jgi:hypothetical protein
MTTDAGAQSLHLVDQRRTIQQVEILIHGASAQ